MLGAPLVVAVVVMVASLLPPGLFDGGALLDARVVRLPLELGLGRERQDAFHRLAVVLLGNVPRLRLRGHIPDFEDSLAT